MAKKRFDEQMQAYDHWKVNLIKGIQHYQTWLDANNMGEPEDELHIYEVLESLRADHLVIAFVAEFARGKTELINAIFFSEYDRRLLPSEAGRTTMCPTELFFDNTTKQSYIRLLPIETRLSDTSIAEYKADPIHWTHIDLDLDNPDSMADAFQEIVRTKLVELEDARKLGLYSDADQQYHAGGKAPKEVEVPLWRHALISFPHPLLKQGLVILDTPGLNAIGSEPELTLNMLPNAQAVVFLLAADTGVTKSDMEMWQHNVKPLRSTHEKGLIVVLNKVDTLWDELKSEEQINKTVAEQRVTAAKMLGIGLDNIFPASAQKGLLAKIRHNAELLQKSNIPALEDILAHEILPHKQTLVREYVANSVGSLIKGTHERLKTRMFANKKQLEELRGLSGKNNDVIEHLMKKTREEQAAYYKNVESFQANKKLLGEQSHKLLDMLAMGAIDELITYTRKAMSDSWTTPGLKKGMKTFFDGITNKLDEVVAYSEKLNRLVITVYRKFHQEHGVAEIKPTLYSINKYARELRDLYQEAEAFRNSPVTTMTEQTFVIKKFFISLVSHARNIFFKAHSDAESWSKAVMSPLVKQIKEHKDQMEQRLENLRKINESRDTLQTRIKELERASKGLEKQFREISAILNLIDRPLEHFAPAPAPAKARAAAG